ncbi:MAG: response regulator, partial [Lachnospiraceae bacterium]|nr:response regulator [Lachnospiraceae bacterium]
TAKDVRAVNQERNLALAVSESKSQFLASMSHEILTPINTIMGMNEMILRESKEENTREYADNINRASEMLLGLINDVLDLSKIEAGKLQILEADYSTADMLKAVVSGIEMRARRKELEIKKDIDETLPAVLSGDEIRIKQILNNLLSNAVKYTETGFVTLTAKGIRKETGFFLQLAVSDTGMGISEEDIEHLFDTFVRLDLKKNQNIEGTGLGLSITKQLVENMGGSITVTSEVGKGSCFTVEIPQTIIDETAMGSLESKNVNTPIEAESPEKTFKAPDAKVLVVDDNKMNLKVIGNLLKRTEMQVDFANDGNQCLEMTKEKKYDIILMDHMMPEPDGVETLHLLRADQDNKNLETPVIVLTANAVGDVEAQYLEEGFDGYLSKPIDVDKMEKTLSKYI